MLARLAIVLFALAACGHAESKNVKGDDDDRGSAKQQPLELVAVGPAPPHWTDVIPARVVFDETHTSRIGSPLGGRVSAVMVELGQHVKVGTPLLTVTSGDLADLYSARDKAKVDLDASQTNYNRTKSLVELGSLPKKELDSAEQDLREARVSYDTANAKIASLKVIGGGATAFTISSTRDGVIVEKNVAVGQQVSPDSGSIIAIADLSDVWVVADLLEDAVDDIKAGSKCEVTLDGTLKLDGVVEQVAAIVDPDRHTVPVRVKLPNAAGLLRPNALAQIRFYENSVGPLAVPAEAILSDGATTYVYVMRDGRPKRQDVVAGPINSSMVPIREGLVAGDQVVARGASLLDNQLPVDDRKPTPKQP